MSGIAAMFRADGGPVDAAVLEAMAGAMSYRGLTGRSGGGTAMLAHAGEVGPASQTRFHIAFDGYLLNGPELRRELAERGVHLPGTSDAETALHAFSQWDEAALARFEGEFALVIWDAQEHRLTCARDHLGLRPLCWHWDGRQLLVASDIAAIIAAMPEHPPINTGYMAEHLANCWYTQDETVWQGVNKLRPAHWLAFAQGGSTPAIREYWTLPTGVTIRYASDADYVEHYLALLDEVVRGAATSDAPVAAEVSGGLDSSAIFALAAKSQQDGALAAPGLHGFALRGHPGDYSDEIAHARSVAAHWGHGLTECALFEPSLDWFCEQGRNDATLAFAPNAAMMAGLHAAMAEAGVRVCLNGHGGDVWLNGSNAQFNQTLRLRDWSGAARSLAADRRDFGAAYALRKGVRQGLGLIAPTAAKRVLRRIEAQAPHPLETLFWLSEEAKQALAERRARFEAELEAAPEHERHKLARLKEPFTVLVNEITNLMAAKQSIEYRSPMQSRRFVEFCAATPEHLKRRGKLRKWLHREAMRGILPESVRMRGDKAFFDSTFRRLQGETRAYCSQHMAAKPFAELVRADGVEALFRQFYAAEIDAGAIWELWGAFSSVAFCRDFAAPEQEQVQ